ncbi:MAG: GIY-YIG nuclease family protein [Candidatus Harrisonbacteria bacterium]|nr:GIY-YIG nuclease family protein [Candidatus Harrisonbacteria bacterium]
MLPQIIKKIKSAPKSPGIYIFYQNQTPLYVGKASNLKNRLQNYLKITDIKTESLHREANKLELIKLNSNIEALIIESKLIKELKPKYNILWRDDKNYFYAAITREKFPRIFAAHQLNNPNTEYIGPFTEGNSLKAILRLLRRYFPYCTCKPHLRLCLNSQINNCPGYCCQINDNRQQTMNNRRQITDYKKNITKIKNILTRKDKKFIRQLKDPYELLVLEKIWAHEPYLEQNNRQQDKHYSRVECYDNSHLSGKEAVGAMTSWTKQTTNNNEQQITTKWLANKNSWRKFKIRGNYTEDDPRMMEEIVTRRLNHPEWPYPDLIIIDGGITQFNAAKRAIQKSKVKGRGSNVIKVISFAKPRQLIFGLQKNPVPISTLPIEFQNLIKTAIQNTHNFVIRYHRKIRERKFIKEYN